MTQAVTEPKPKKYRLKSMVLARMLAEITVLLILFVLPVILILTGNFQSTSITIKVVLFSLSLIAALILPAYAFITWRVQTDETGLTTVSLAKKEHCPWSSIKRISRRSNWNWVRYVVEHQGGEISFPIWLVNVDELIELIRQHLPKGAGGAGNPFRKFSQDGISLSFQCMQAALGVGLVVVFWFFFGELAQKQSTNQADLSLVFAFCLIITMICLWRTSVVFLMPKSVELTPSGIIINTMLSSIRVGWQSVLKIAPSYPLLPEGFMLKTERGSYLIGNGMDSADELVSSLQGRIAGGGPTSQKSLPGGNQQVDFSPDGTRSITEVRAQDKEGTNPIDIGSATEDGALEGSIRPAPVDPAQRNQDQSKKSERVENQNEGTTCDTTDETGLEVETTTLRDGANNAKAPGGKKADRRFRRKKKNKPS